MKKFSLVLKLKERELKEEELALKGILNDLRVVELKIKSLGEKVKKLKEFPLEKVTDYVLVSNYLSFLLEQIKKLEVEKENLEQKLEIQKEKLSYKRGEVRILENFVERKQLEKEKKNEVLFERFINEVRCNRYVV